MANTLTSLIPDLYEAMDIVSRELVGFIPSVARDSSLERAAVGQTVRSFVAPASTAVDISPAQLPPDTGDQSIGNKVITISKAKAVPIRWNGEEQKGINFGPGYMNVRRDQMTQAMRNLTNQIEADVSALYVGASRAILPSASTLFSAGLKDVANARKVLADNGAPMDDISLVMSTTAGAELRGLAQLNKANEGGGTELLRQGVLLDVFGVAIRESAQIKQHVKGTGTSYDITGTIAVGATSLVVGDGTGTFVAGDLITIGSDPNTYVVTTGFAGDGAGTVIIAAPGLLKATTDEDVVTILDEAERNVMFSRNAMQLVTRIPARPYEGDRADDVITVQDPRSGLAFEFAMYREYRQVHYEMSCAWGMAVIKPEHMMLLVD